MYNLYTDEDEEIEPSPSGQQIIENSITMNKMKLLKAKMENMNLGKKVKLLAMGRPFSSISLSTAGNCERKIFIKYYSSQVSGLSNLLRY